MVYMHMYFYYFKMSALTLTMADDYELNDADILWYCDPLLRNSAAFVQFV